MMENKYRPDGWLGFIVGSKFWIDFSEKYKLDLNANKLVKELGNRGKIAVQKTIVQGIKMPLLSICLMKALELNINKSCKSLKKLFRPVGRHVNHFVSYFEFEDDNKVLAENPTTYSANNC